MRLRVLIADDEPLARERLRHLLSAHPEVEIVTECRKGRETVAALRERAVDLVFLDIQMPGRDGFNVIADVGAAHMPATIFVTAHDHYAIQAFEVHALDYLTKPVDPRRLESALLRAQGHIAASSALNAQAQWGSTLDSLIAGASKKAAHPERILVPHGNRNVLVKVKEIEWIDAANYYACLHVGTRSLMLRKTIKELAASLDPLHFVRVHRSVIVNLDYVREILREGDDEGSLVMASGQRLRMSPAGWQSLMAASRDEPRP